jgi:hypothetical protein
MGTVRRAIRGTPGRGSSYDGNMASFRSSWLLALFLGACASRPAQPPTPASPSACERLPLLERYARSGLAERLPDGRMRLSVRTDLHAADCGTPDCYGTNLTAIFRLSPEGAACHVREVDVNAKESGCGIPEEEPPRSETFFAQGASDLADPTLEKLTLMSRTGELALVILHDNLFYFDDVKPGGELYTRLSNDTGDAERCCWGASMSEVHFKD